jgi:peptidoglycan hydrolase CwlO-like protein
MNKTGIMNYKQSLVTGSGELGIRDLARRFVLLSLFLVVLFILHTSYFILHTASAEPNCSSPGPGDIDHCLQKIKDEINALAPANETNKQELSGLKKQIDSLTGRINSISKLIDQNKVNIAEREEDLAYTKLIFEEKTRDHYQFLRLYDPILPFLSSTDASGAFREIAFRAKAATSDIKAMEGLAGELIKLKSDKENLEKNQVSLASAKSSVSERAKFLEGEIKKTDVYLSSLSAKQEALLAAKSGGFTASVGDSDLADDYNASIKGFRESAPAGSFAVFSFGGYTHRKGMSQYGARGRAQNGQNANQILKAYYGNEPISKDTNGTISVAGIGNVNFEEYYLMGIAEMPSNWNPEALKAQAIAARTYAYRYKSDGKTICTDEACQVFRKSKADNPPDAWKKAVQETKGQIVEGVVTYYSSTAGGFLTTSGWDTTDGSGGSSFLDKTYEKLGGSPWVYKAWYRKGYSNSGETCGRSSPWLTNEEFTDIVNAALVLKQGSDDRITSVSVSCWGGNPYNMSELKQKGGLQSVSSVSVVQGNGATGTVIINGSINFSGEEFKRAFNLRAPGFLMVPQKGFSFFNIEKK